MSSGPFDREDQRSGLRYKSLTQEVAKCDDLPSAEASPEQEPQNSFDSKIFPYINLIAKYLNYCIKKEVSALYRGIYITKMFFLDALAHMISFIHGSLNASLSIFNNANIVKSIGFESFSLFL